MLFRKEVYLPYQHREWIPGCVKHPGNIVEPASLAVIESISVGDSDIAQSLPEAAVSKGKLSSLQLESIAKAVSFICSLMHDGGRQLSIPPHTQ